MSIRTAFAELRAAAGTTQQLRHKARSAWQSVRTLLDRNERMRRYDRLRSLGLADQFPTDWQLILASYDMLVDFLLPSNREFYEQYGRSHWWAQVLRFVDDPSSMLDPTGFGISQQVIVSHLVQVVHTSAGYDVALLAMFEDGLARLRVELQQLIDGTHPRQQIIETLVERVDYHQKLLAALDQFERDPVQHWQVRTCEPPRECEPLLEWGLETFGTPGRLLAYGCRLPATPIDSLRLWWSGEKP